MRSEQSSPGSSEAQGERKRTAMLTLQGQIPSAEILAANSTTFCLFIGSPTRSIELRTLGRTGGSPFVARVWEETEAKPRKVMRTRQDGPVIGRRDHLMHRNPESPGAERDAV